MIDTFQGKVKR